MTPDKWIKVRVPQQLHYQLRSTAFMNNESLSGFVVRILSRCMGDEKWTKPEQDKKGPK